MRIPDLIPLRPMPGGSLLATPARSAAGAGAQAPAAAWFDAVAHEDAVAIVADPSCVPRALSVEQHAARVLQALCGGPDGAP